MTDIQIIYLIAIIVSLIVPCMFLIHAIYTTINTLTLDKKIQSTNKNYNIGI